MSLTTGQHLNRYQWTPLPMPQEVINKVHVLAHHNPASPPGQVFGNCNGAPLINNDDDHDLGKQSNDDNSTYVPDNNDHDSSDEENSDYDSDHNPDDDSNDNDDDDDGPTAGVPDDETDKNEPADEDNEGNSGTIAADPTKPGSNDEAAHHQLILECEMDTKYGLCTRKPRSYVHLHMMHECLDDPVSNITLTQYSINKGLKVFGKVGADAVVKELQQLHDRVVMKPMAANGLTDKEHQNALQYLMFLKQK